MLRSGQLPTFGDLEKAGFDRSLVKEAVRLKIIEEFYVTAYQRNGDEGVLSQEKSHERLEEYRESRGGLEVHSGR